MLECFMTKQYLQTSMLVQHAGWLHTALVKSSVELLRQVRANSAIAQSRNAASRSDYQSADKLFDRLRSLAKQLLR